VARREGIGLDGLASSGYFERTGPPGIIVGYGACPEAAFERAVDALAGVVAAVVPRG